MRNIKKATATMLATAVIVSSAGVYDTGAATTQATTPKILNGKAKKITAGESFKIVVKASGKVKFKSENKKIAKVSKKGVVKAIKPGKVTITVKSASKSAKVKVTVNPAKVKAVSATSDIDQAKVTWTKVKNATGYEVYCSTTEKKGFKKVATVKGGSVTSVDLKDLKSGTYYFKVKALAKAGKKTLKSDYSDVSEAVKVWTLTWSDEFNGNSLDTNNWSFATGQTGWGNQEWQNYTSSGNYEVKDGSLVIIPRINYNKATRKFDAKSATSARINTKGKKEFKYGKMEIRAKAAKAFGTWSAGWMLGADCDTNIWPKCGEIDIMGAVNDKVSQCVWRESFSASGRDMNTEYNTGLTKQQAAEKFSVYTVTWTDDAVEFSVDGKVVGTYSISNIDGAKRKNVWPFDHEFFFVLNCAISGNATEINDPTKSYDATGWTVVSENGDVQTLEDYFYVDYVRVYQ